MKTYSARPGDVEKKWYLIDAEGLVVGRLAAVIATRLRGKHKPQFSPHVDCGDALVVVNADKLALTGRKRTDKTYYRHTGYPGGIKTAKAGDILDGRFPERVLSLAVKRMMPDNKLSRRQLTHLRIFGGPNHDHAAQTPEILDFGALNRKNRAA